MLHMRARMRVCCVLCVCVCVCVCVQPHGRARMRACGCVSVCGTGGSSCGRGWVGEPCAALARAEGRALRFSLVLVTFTEISHFLAVLEKNSGEFILEPKETS